MSDQRPIPPLDKCAECHKSFSKGQEYWELKRDGVIVMNSCVPCWDKHTFEKKQWEK